MSRKTLSMRKITEVARLKASGLSIRQIAGSCDIACSTVGEYLKRLGTAGLNWPFPPELSEEDLEARLFRRPETRGRDQEYPVPCWPTLHKELRRKGVTLRLLWEEYRQIHPEGYGYSQFCEHYRRWRKTLDVCMRQSHRGGEKLFVDYAGMTMPVVDSGSGAIYAAQIFVAALGASQYLYAEATRTQQLEDWIGSHIRTYAFLGGVSEIVVPDNLKSGVTKACRYEPQLNRSYADMAGYYGTAVIPARPLKPKDKAKVESGVLIVEREILARIRDYTFFSLAALNEAIRVQLDRVNKRRFQKLDCSRLELFEQLDKPVLKPLPVDDYQICEFYAPRVNIDYHVEIQGHYYSVPFELNGQKIEVRLSARMVEVLHKGKRVASHVRDGRKGQHTTDSTHMPKAHRKHLEWSPSRIIHWAGQIGPHCAQVAEQIMKTRPHPEQGYRACLGLMRLSKGYDTSRLESACHRALALDVCSYQSIKSILKTGMDREPLSSDGMAPTGCLLEHGNLRGRSYYGTGEGESLEPSAMSEKGGCEDLP
jgi:transposase